MITLAQTSVEFTDPGTTFLYSLFLVAALVLLAAGVLERRRHRANLERLRFRVHVNGIRGKSSITRLTAGALRGGDLRVAAKTTGSAARYIFPDGSEEPLFRKFGQANIVEQIGIVRRAAADSVDALVIECMAVQPHLQEFDEVEIVRSNIGILCNVREDHLLEMGPTLEDVARSLSRAMPRGGICFTAEKEWFDVLKEEADRYGTELVYVDPEDVTDAEMDAFTHFTFKENVALALAVARQAGISRGAAMRGMWAAAPDPGVLTVETYRIGGKVLRVANVLAANDPASTVLNFQELMRRELISPPVFTMINCRPDRLERNVQMGEIVPQLLTETLFLVGEVTRSARSGLPKGWSGRVIEMDGLDHSAEAVFEAIMNEIDEEATLIAVGNIHGQGERLLAHLETLGAVR